jgi:hypothetical protein
MQEKPGAVSGCVDNALMIQGCHKAGASEVQEKQE